MFRHWRLPRIWWADTSITQFIHGRNSRAMAWVKRSKIHGWLRTNLDSKFLISFPHMILWDSRKYAANDLNKGRLHYLKLDLSIWFIYYCKWFPVKIFVILNRVHRLPPLETHHLIHCLSTTTKPWQQSAAPPLSNCWWPVLPFPLSVSIIIHNSLKNSIPSLTHNHIRPCYFSFNPLAVPSQEATVVRLNKSYFKKPA